MKELKLALLGFGNVGQAFARMILDYEDRIKDRYDYKIKVTAITTGSKGNLYNPEGIDLELALDDVAANGKFAGGHCEKWLTDMDSLTVVNEAEYDAIMEMTPLNIFTGEPAISHIRGAFARGKHAVTANKGPIAWAFKDLKKEAKATGSGFFYETTVMDGTPVFNLVEHTLKLAEVTEVSGILNSTTNFILEEMAAGGDYDDIIRRGREMGFIEADASMDIDGYDAAAKITALLNVLMDAGITPDKVDRTGIGDITMADIEAAAGRGKVIKLLCSGQRLEDGTVKASVKPVEVDRTDMLAADNRTTSIVSITTDMMKKVSVVEHEPEIEQTAYGVFGDMLRVIEFIKA